MGGLFRGPGNETRFFVVGEIGLSDRGNLREFHLPITHQTISASPQSALLNLQRYDFPSGIGPLSGLVHQAEATYRIQKYVHLLACKSTSGLHSSKL